MMKVKKITLLLLALNICTYPVFSQLFEIAIPFSANEKDAPAVGYFNPHNHTFVLEQQSKGIITRMLYDTLFNLKKKYMVPADSVTFTKKSRKPLFLKEYCTAENTYEIYANNKGIEIWQLDFETGTEKKTAALALQEHYKDERIIAIVPGIEKVSFLTHSPKQEKVFLYNYFPGKSIFLQRDFALPEQSLTKEELKERGKFLAVKYPAALSGLLVSDLKNPGNYQISPANQLLYNDTAIFIIIGTPYNAGVHLLQLNRNNGNVSFKNFLINKINPDKIGSSIEKIPVATAYDSLLIIQNSNAAMLEYNIYNINTKALIKKYRAEDDNSLYSIVHSHLRQIGTYGSKDEEKELTNERRFLRRKNKGALFIKATKADNDSMVITFGSFVFTEGIGGTFLSLATSNIGLYLFTPVSAFGVVPYLTLSRNKFLFAHSKFSLQTLQPSLSTNLVTPIDKIANDKKIDDLERNSSFIIDCNKKLYVGIFNKSKDKYEIFTY
jgi:hypothetical protein